jgi:tRNA A37 threonylcarbamoyladenosine biosynthesis protein TsaE
MSSRSFIESSNHRPATPSRQVACSPDYLVTDQLALHGSFGAGKSLFMAALYLLLQGNTAAPSLTKLAQSLDAGKVIPAGSLT